MLHMAQMMATETCLCESTNYFEKAQYEACKTALVNYLSDFEKIHLKISEDFEASYSDKTHNIGCICDVNKSDDIPVECTMCLKWSIQLNISVCSLMDLHLQKKKNCEEISVVCEKFQSLLQEMHGMTATIQHLNVEIVTLYNYLNVLLGYDVLNKQEWSEHVLLLVNKTLQRVFHVSTGSIPAVHRKFIDELISFIEGIVLHFENISLTSLELLTHLCYGIAWLLSLQNNFSPLFNFFKAVQNLDEVYNTKKALKNKASGFICLFPKNVITSRFPTTSELYYLLIACSSINEGNNTSALQYLERIDCPAWEHFIGYAKAFLQYGDKQFISALETVWPLWKSRHKTEDWMAAKLSNIIGCCILQQGGYNMSIKWFQKAISMDSTFLLPLWNMACAFQKLGKVKPSGDALELLVRALLTSGVNELSCDNLLYGSLWLEPEPEITSSQAIYLLAHYYLSSHCYMKSASYYSKLLEVMKKESSLLRSVPYIYLGIPSNLCQIYWEASYAFLHAGMYQRCIEICDAVTKHCFYCSSVLEDIDTLNNPAKNEACDVPSINICTVLPEKETMTSLHSLFSICYKDQKKLKHLGDSSVQSNQNSLSSETIKSFNCSRMELKNCDNSFHLDNNLHGVLLLLIQSSAKYHLKNVEETCKDLRKAQKILLTYQNRNGHSDTNVKTEINSENSKKTDSLEANQEKSLISQVYNNIAVTSISKGLWKEAYHYLRIALISNPGNLDAIYNYCLLQVKVDKAEVGKHFWLTTKQKLETIDHILITDNLRIFPYTVTAQQLRALDDAFNRL